MTSQPCHDRSRRDLQTPRAPVAGAAALSIALLAAIAPSSCSSSDTAAPAGTSSGTTTSATGGSGGQGGGSACDACQAGERCFQQGCIPDNGTCTMDEPCQNDSDCVDGVCVPFGSDPPADFDPECKREPAPLAAFKPAIQCEWPGEQTVELPKSTSVRVPPLVIDLDGDKVPEIVFVTWDLDTAPTYPARIRAIRGDDCTPVWTSSHTHDFNQSLAAGDVDGDGKPEVCGRGSRYDNDCVPFCLKSDGSLLWEAHDQGQPFKVACNTHDVGISIVNVDGQGTPELVVGLSVFDGASGKLLGTHAEPTISNPSATWSHNIPALADVDGDGHVEALTGGWIYDLVDNTLVDWGAETGYTAVAELSAAHPGPEVVVVSTSQAAIRVHALDGTELFKHAIPGGAGGPPTVADLDGDGRAELSAAGNNFITAFDLDCVGPAPDPKLCPSANTDGVMWSVPTHEYSSGFTGSSVFDFEGDGPVEVVYGDECWVRVLDGTTGKVKFSAPHESLTGIEYPVIADVDGDYFTELVVPHELYNSGCPASDPLMPEVSRDPQRRYAGITVYRDENDAWSPSRPIWDQHTFHVGQRNVDGTVPAVEIPSWTTHNSYRRQLPTGTALDMPDLTVSEVGGPACDEGAQSQVLKAQVCNRGTLGAGAGVVVAFYLGKPGGEPLCSATTGVALGPGECTEVSCVWEGVPKNESHDIHAVVDDDEQLLECKEDNNRGDGAVSCPPVPS